MVMCMIPIFLFQHPQQTTGEQSLERHTISQLRLPRDHHTARSCAWLIDLWLAPVVHITFSSPWRERGLRSAENTIAIELCDSGTARPRCSSDTRLVWVMMVMTTQALVGEWHSPFRNVMLFITASLRRVDMVVCHAFSTWGITTTRWYLCACMVGVYKHIQYLLSRLRGSCDRGLWHASVLYHD